MKSGKTEHDLRHDHAANALNQASMALAQGDYETAAQRADEALLILKQLEKESKR